MIGCYDFCGHYEWTFEWLRLRGGDGLVLRYWDECIARDSQTHASDLIKSKGFKGMEEYWGHTLAEEAAGYVATKGEGVYKVDMFACPSKGFLTRNHLEQYRDYCDHCIGWIGPVLKEAGFHVHHEHNHGGQCWWEIRKADDPTPPSAPGELSGKADVRLRAQWKAPGRAIDHYVAATHPSDKTVVS
jgi:hypothetical protein